MPTVTDDLSDLRSLPGLSRMTTAERLCHVADIIEAHPRRWDQRSFLSGSPYTYNWAGLGKDPEFVCGTTMCVGGWGIALMPRSKLGDSVTYFASARLAFGFDMALAEAIFLQWTKYRIPGNLRSRIHGGPRIMANVLRDLATLPPGQRTLDRALAEGMLKRNGRRA